MFFVHFDHLCSESRVYPSNRTEVSVPVWRPLNQMRLGIYLPGTKSAESGERSTVLFQFGSGYFLTCRTIRKPIK